jgi:hypothetical protein
VRFRRVVTAIVVPSLVIAGLASAGAFQSGTAHAATATLAPGLPVIGVSQIVADTAHGHLFMVQNPFGGGGSDDPVLVTNLSGDPVGTLANAMRNVTLSPDGQTLYADDGDAVTAISTATLKQTASYPTPGQAAELAVQSGRLWVSYEGSSYSGIGAIDLTDGTADWNAVPIDYVGVPPAIAVDPSDTGILVATGDAFTGATLTAFNVSNRLSRTGQGHPAAGHDLRQPVVLGVRDNRRIGQTTGLERRRRPGGRPRQLRRRSAA